MGVCYTEKKSKPSEQSSTSKVLNPNANFNKTYNPNSIIENKSNSTIVKKISEINGDAIRLQNNKSCVIMIMDYSSSVSIQECNDCSIFIAPCSGSIIIRKCQNVNLISASSQLRITDVVNSSFFSFSSTPPAIESSKGINIGMFFVQYMELPEMFRKAKLNIWTNEWSQFEKFGNEVDVKYCSDHLKQDIITKFSAGFNDSYVSCDQYQFIPFEYGKSIDVHNESNLVLVFKEEDCVDSEVLKFLSPDELTEKHCKLVKTLVLNESSPSFTELKQKISTSSNTFLVEYMNKTRLIRQKTNNSNIGESQLKNNKLNALDVTGNADNTCNNITTMKYLSKGQVLLLWVVNDSGSFEDLRESAEATFDWNNIGWITKEDTHDNEESSFQNYIRKLFLVTE